MAVDWWRPIGEPGQVAVKELLDPEVWPRYFVSDPDVELELGRTAVHDVVLDLRARRLARSVRCGDQVVAELDLSGPTDFSGGWDKRLSVLGTPGRAVRRVDEDRPSRLRGALRYVDMSVGDRRWVWHFEGGRAAGERLVLRAGESPSAAEPLVTTYPSAHRRSLGDLKGGATRDTRVVSWTATASPIDVVVAELCAMSSLYALIDYRASRVAAGVTELLGHAPRADANTE